MGEGSPQPPEEPQHTFHESWLDDVRASQRETMRQQITALLATHTSVETLAKLLGAKEFLKRIPSRSHRAGDVLEFDVEGFLDHAEQREQPLLLPKRWQQRTTILPTSENLAFQAGEGERPQEKTEVPRTRFLIELLSELGATYEICEGIVTPDMVRQQPYFGFYLPETKHLILVCNESGNATFVAYNIGPDEVTTVLDSTKQAIDTQWPVEHISYRGDPTSWKHAVAQALARAELPEIRAHKAPTGHEIPDGWQRLDELAASYGLHRSTLTKWLKTYYAEDSNRVRVITIKLPERGSTRATIIDDGLARAIKERITALHNLPEPPDDWQNAYDFARTHGIQETSAQSLLRQATKSHPEWSGKFRSRQARQALRPGVYYHPDAFAAAKAILTDPSVVPRSTANKPYREDGSPSPRSWRRVVEPTTFSMPGLAKRRPSLVHRVRRKTSQSSTTPMRNTKSSMSRLDLPHESETVMRVRRLHPQENTGPRKTRSSHDTPGRHPRLNPEPLQRRLDLSHRRRLWRGTPLPGWPDRHARRGAQPFPDPQDCPGGRRHRTVVESG